MIRIPVNSPLLDGSERENVLECLETGWISSEGPFVQRLEDGMAKLTGRRHAIAVCNGTAALEATVCALGIGPGDEVILPTFTIISCAAAVVRAGAQPIVVDCEPDTWNMNVDQVIEAITPRTRAIIAVHIYGLPVELDRLLEVSMSHGLLLIEDAAEMHGQTYHGQPCGSFGEASIFSFYPNKLITTGEGGMILTDDAALAAKCRSLRNLCFQEHRRFVHEDLGWNMRMSNLQAAIGVAQIERMEEFVSLKRRIGQTYRETLADLPGIQVPMERSDAAENIYWVFGIVLDDQIPFSAAEAMRRLAEHGVETRPFFWPMHEQPVFRRMGLFETTKCPVAERLARRGFYLPSGLGLSTNDIIYVAEAVHKILAP